MEEKVKQAVESYQCPGCIKGYNTECYKPGTYGVECSDHRAGTYISNIGKILLGMPKGFNRLGIAEETKINIFDTFNEKYDTFNVPTWKHLNKAGHVLVRGHMPRRNEPFIDIFLENCLDRIQCEEIT